LQDQKIGLTVQVTGLSGKKIGLAHQHYR